MLHPPVPLKFATAAVSHAIPKVRPQGGSHIKSTIEMTIQMGNCDEVMIDHGIAGFQATKNFKKTNQNWQFVLLESS